MLKKKMQKKKKRVEQKQNKKKEEAQVIKNKLNSDWLKNKTMDHSQININH